MKSFNEISHYDFEARRQEDIANEIKHKGKDYILRVDETEFTSYLFEKYKLDPLILDQNPDPIPEPHVSKEKMNSRLHGSSYEVDVYTFTISYGFTGSEELFSVHSNPWSMCSCDIDVNSRSNKVSFKFKVYKLDAGEFAREKEQCYQNAFANVVNINKNAADFNRELPGVINRLFNSAKQKYLSENDFFAAINVKTNAATESVFTAPTIKKKIIPQPAVSKTKEYSSEPMMSVEMYNDLLKVVYDSGKNMEKKPALYMGKDEEGLRDQFLFVLETRYEATTASGETFNRSGKTDIILKYAPDGSNLFVAECKFWHGAAEFQAAISQLFDRYLTWRDSKAALLMFVKNKDFSNVLSVIKKEAEQHPLFVRQAGSRGESSFSYIFCLPQDKDKQVIFEIIAFHYDK